MMSCATSLNSGMSHEQLMQNRSVEAKQIKENATFKDCNKTRKGVFGAIRLNNNQWGKDKLKGKSMQQCVYALESGDKTSFAWEWQIPDNAKGVIAYPSVMVGRGPWGGEKKRINGFPIRVDKIENLTVNYETELYVKHKKYNLAFDLWLTNTEFSKSENITHEIMVWEDKNDFRSFGKKRETIRTPFGVYDVYLGHMVKKDKNLDWNYAGFIRTNTRQSGQVDLNYFLNYLKSINYIQTNLHLTSIEFGTEVGNSSGYAWIKQFDWSLIEKE